MKKSDVLFKEIATTRNFKFLSEDELDILINKIIKCTKTNGLLYKYKNLNVDETEFNYIYEPLLKKYLYLPSVEQMNDEIDTTFAYKTLHTENDIYNYHSKNRYRIEYFNSKLRKANNVDRLIVLRGLANNKTDIEIASSFSKKYRNFSQKLKFVKEVRGNIDTIYGDNNNLKPFVESYDKLIDNLRHDIHIYSFTESYRDDSMWAYYGGKNTGLCIVYDFKKAKKASIDVKRLLVSIGKIMYSDEKREMDVLDIYDYIYSQEQSNKKYRQLSYRISKLLFTKRRSWKHEKEWRLIHNNENFIIPVDLVKGLIIDKKIIDSDRSQKLIKLASERKWFVKIRKLNHKTMEYEYKRIN